MSYLYFKPGTTKKQMVEMSKDWQLNKEIKSDKQVCDMCKHDQFTVYFSIDDPRMYCSNCGFSQLTEYIKKGEIKRMFNQLIKNR